MELPNEFRVSEYIRSRENNMKNLSTAIISFLFTSFLFTCLAGDTLNLRMVKVSNQGQGVDHGLSDVGPLLSSQLPFKRFRLVDEKNGNLKVSSTLSVAHGYTVQYSGSQADLNLIMRHENDEVLKTSVQLLDNKPLILGGFPSENGKLIFILIAK